MGNIFHVRIETSNTAFEESSGHPEVARILRQVADEIDHGWSNGKIHDSNGNEVGEYEW